MATKLWSDDICVNLDDNVVITEETRTISSTTLKRKRVASETVTKWTGKLFKLQLDDDDECKETKTIPVIQLISDDSDCEFVCSTETTTTTSKSIESIIPPNVEEPLKSPAPSSTTSTLSSPCVLLNPTSSTDGKETTTALSSEESSCQNSEKEGLAKIGKKFKRRRKKLRRKLNKKIKNCVEKLDNNALKSDKCEELPLENVTKSPLLETPTESAQKSPQKSEISIFTKTNQVPLLFNPNPIYNNNLITKSPLLFNPNPVVNTSNFTFNGKFNSQTPRFNFTSNFPCSTATINTNSRFRESLQVVNTAAFWGPFLPRENPRVEITPKNLRPIAIDGSNVAYSHGKSKIFSCKGIQICVDYFIKRGHSKITAFVPLFRRSSPPCEVQDRYILDNLSQGPQYVVFTPSRRLGKKLIYPYDDRFILDYASQTGAIVVSNDNYRDLMSENVKFRETVEKRLLMYTFVDDIFMVPEDPMGLHGPSLNNFLRFK